MRVRAYLSKRQRKELMRKLFEDLLSKYRFLIVVDAKGLRQKLLTKVRMVSEEYGFIIKGGKNGVFLKAVERVYPKSLPILKNLISGQNMFIFTNNDPVETALKLLTIKVSLPISPGEVAPSDIVVPAGNTGIPPGPIVSMFSALNIPTRIISGAIHIIKDTVVVKAGERASMEAASLLQKLGIYPIESRLKFKFAIDFRDNIVIKSEDLTPNIDELIESAKEAVATAFKLAIAINYPHSRTMPILLQRAYLKAYNMSVKIGYITDATIKALLITANRKAKLLKTYLRT